MGNAYESTKTNEASEVRFLRKINFSHRVANPPSVLKDLSLDGLAMLAECLRNGFPNKL